MAPIDVLIPTKPTAAASPVRLAARDALPQRPRLTLIANGKPRARELLEMLAEALEPTLSFASVTLVTKPGASMLLSDDELADIAARSDLAIAALGDCGACSACSLNDTVALERLGVPTTLIITEVFQRTVADFSASLGLPGYQPIVVPHPVSSRSIDHLRGVIADAAPVALRLLAPAVPAHA